MVSARVKKMLNARWGKGKWGSHKKKTAGKRKHKNGRSKASRIPVAAANRKLSAAMKAARIAKAAVKRIKFKGA